MRTEKIFYWPQWFCESLSKAEKKRIDPCFLKKLKDANVWLWRALNIYDDFYDGEGIEERLSLANTYQRRFLETYYRLDLPDVFYLLFDHILNDTDRKNGQEAADCRLETAGQITPAGNYRFPGPLENSRKSLALALAPLAILYRLDKNIPYARVQSTINFFRHLLSAKQLADDSRDWFDDLEKGILTSVNALVLEAARERRLTLDLKASPEIAYLLFAAGPSETICVSLASLCRETRRCGRLAGFGGHSRFIQETIRPIEKALSETAAFRARLKEKS